jgi:hypothetical protein
VLPGTCVDKRPDCKKYYGYESTACDGKYRNWMFTNCLKTCGVCRKNFVSEIISNTILIANLGGKKVWSMN